MSERMTEANKADPQQRAPKPKSTPKPKKSKNLYAKIVHKIIDSRTQRPKIWLNVGEADGVKVGMTGFIVGNDRASFSIGGFEGGNAWALIHETMDELNKQPNVVVDLASGGK